LRIDRFLANLIPALMAANPPAWRVTKIALDKIVADTRAELSLTLKRRGKTIHMIDDAHRVAWEEEGRMFGERRTFAA
jgi:hypothetical protein